MGAVPVLGGIWEIVSSRLPELDMSQAKLPPEPPERLESPGVRNLGVDVHRDVDLREVRTGRGLQTRLFYGEGRERTRDASV